jgi:hypothetical protein
LLESIELYAEGVAIDEIADELRMTSDDVTKHLRSYKIKEENGRDYIYIFKEFVVDRVLSRVPRGTICKELGIAYRTINKYLKEFEVEVPTSSVEQESEMYQEISWDDFNRCPDCGSIRVNHINLYSEATNDNSYCLDCGTEWVQMFDGRVCKILWDFVR